MIREQARTAHSSASRTGEPIRMGRVEDDQGNRQLVYVPQRELLARS